jgi:hypothetical protein
VHLEEVLEQLPIRDPLWIENDLDRFGVADIVLLGRVLVLAAGPTHTSGQDTVPAAE